MSGWHTILPPYADRKEKKEYGCMFGMEAPDEFGCLGKYGLHVTAAGSNPLTKYHQATRSSFGRFCAWLLEIKKGAEPLSLLIFRTASVWAIATKITVVRLAFYFLAVVGICPERKQLDRIVNAKDISEIGNFIISQFKVLIAVGY